MTEGLRIAHSTNVVRARSLPFCSSCRCSRVGTQPTRVIISTNRWVLGRITFNVVALSRQVAVVQIAARAFLPNASVISRKWKWPVIHSNSCKLLKTSQSLSHIKMSDVGTIVELPDELLFYRQISWQRWTLFISGYVWSYQRIFFVVYWKQVMYIYTKGIKQIWTPI